MLTCIIIYVLFAMCTYHVAGIRDKNVGVDCLIACIWPMFWLIRIMLWLDRQLMK